MQNNPGNAVLNLSTVLFVKKFNHTDYTQQSLWLQAHMYGQLLRTSLKGGKASKEGYNILTMNQDQTAIVWSASEVGYNIFMRN